MIRFDLTHPTFCVASILAQGVELCPSPAPLLAEMAEAEAALRATPDIFPESVRVEVRNVLRVGGYKPTGRGKPASEFLLGAATSTGLPRVNNLVDINNLVSVRSALPISMFDLERLGSEATVRFGRSGENYVFNVSGQLMDIAGIPVVCSAEGEIPIGNAVKDSMLAKVGPDTHSVLAVVYGSTKLAPGYLEQVAQQLGELLCQYAAAKSIEIQVT